MGNGLPLFLAHTAEPAIVLVEGLLPRWATAEAKDQLPVWRSLAIYLFDCANLLSREGLASIALDHDALAMLAMQRAHDLQPLRVE